MQARTEGMAYALKIAGQGGIEELEKEIKFRNLTGISLNLSRKDLNTALMENYRLKYTKIIISILRMRFLYTV